jgi:hypothetical protein
MNTRTKSQRLAAANAVAVAAEAAYATTRQVVRLASGANDATFAAAIAAQTAAFNFWNAACDEVGSLDDQYWSRRLSA